MKLQEIFNLDYTNDVISAFLKIVDGVIPLREWSTLPWRTRKGERAQMLADVLLNPQHLARLWQAMDDLSRKAVAVAFHNGGDFVSAAFIAQYGDLPRRSQTSGWYYSQTPILIELFLHKGQIPPELMAALADLVPPPERFQLDGVAEIDKLIRSKLLRSGDKRLEQMIVVPTEEAGWHDLLLFLQLVDQQAIKLNPAGDKLIPSGVSTLLTNLLHGDFENATAGGAQEPLKPDSKLKPEDKVKADETIRPFGLTQFAKGAGLISGYDRGGLTELGRDYLTRQEPEALLDAFEKWCKESKFDEITRIDAIRGLRSRGIQLSAPGRRRERIVEALSWCPVNVWIEVEEFYRALKIWLFDFEIEEGGLYKLYVGERYGGRDSYVRWGSNEDMWLLTNGLYVKAILWEYLAVIGALDIAYLPPSAFQYDLSPEFEIDLDYDFDAASFSRYDGLCYFRINKLGAYLFGQAGDYHAATATSAPLLRVEADNSLHLLDLARMTPVIKAQLDQMAVPEGEALYRLDAQKVLLALEQGAELATLADFLVRQSAQPLPPQVSSWLDQQHNASRAFSVDQPMLRIRAASAELVQLVLADAELQKFCHSIGSRALVIPASRESRFRQRLRGLAMACANQSR